MGSIQEIIDVTNYLFMSMRPKKDYQDIRKLNQKCDFFVFDWTHKGDMGHRFSSKKINKNISAPNFFNPKLTRPKLFQTECTPRKAVQNYLGIYNLIINKLS